MMITDLLEKTRTGKHAIWTGYFKRSNKLIAVVSKHCNKKWIIFRKRGNGGKHCLVTLNEGDQVLMLGNYNSNLYVLTVILYHNSQFKTSYVVHGNEESLKDKVINTNRGLTFVLDKMIQSLKQKKCACWGEVKFKNQNNR